MRRILLLVILSLALPFVTACDEIIDDATEFVTDFFNDDEENNSNNESNNLGNDKDETDQAVENDEKNQTENEADETSSGTMLADDLKQSVFDKAKEVAKTVKNQEVYFSVDQVYDYGYFKVGSIGEFIVHISYDPVSLYQTGTVMVDGETHYTEMYVQGNDIYVYMDMLDSWINLGGIAAAFSDEDIADPADFQSAEEQLEIIEGSLEHFSLEETETSYVFRLDSKGPEADALYKKLLQGHSGNIEDMLDEGQNLNEGVFKSFEYTISFDKKTYHADKYNMAFELGIEGEDQLKIIFSADSKFVNINEMGPVEIPDEVKGSSGFPF